MFRVQRLWRETVWRKDSWIIFDPEATLDSWKVQISDTTSKCHAETKVSFSSKVAGANNFLSQSCVLNGGSSTENYPSKKDVVKAVNSNAYALQRTEDVGHKHIHRRPKMDSWCVEQSNDSSAYIACRHSAQGHDPPQHSLKHINVKKSYTIWN